MLTGNKKVVVSTGNILNANKKAGQKTTEEVSRIIQNHLEITCSFFLVFFTCQG